MDDKAHLLLTDWFRRVRESQRTHYECAARYSRLNHWFGIPTIILTAGVGTAVFASLEQVASGRMRIIVGLVSICATVLASLQTFLGFATRASKHLSAGAEYGSIRRTLEHLKTFEPASTDELKEAMGEIQKRMDDLAATAPEVPPSVKARIDRELKSRAHKRVFTLPAASAESAEAKIVS